MASCYRFSCLAFYPVLTWLLSYHYEPNRVQSFLLSQIRPLWLSPITTRGSIHQSPNRFLRTSFPITLCLGLIICTGVNHFLDDVGSVNTILFHLLAQPSVALLSLYSLFVFYVVCPDCLLDPVCLAYLTCYLSATCPDSLLAVTRCVPDKSCTWITMLLTLRYIYYGFLCSQLS